MSKSSDCVRVGQPVDVFDDGCWREAILRHRPVPPQAVAAAVAVDDAKQVATPGHAAPKPDDTWVVRVMAPWVPVAPAEVAGAQDIAVDVAATAAAGGSDVAVAVMGEMAVRLAHVRPACLWLGQERGWVSFWKRQGE